MARHLGRSLLIQEVVREDRVRDWRPRSSARTWPWSRRSRGAEPGSGRTGTPHLRRTQRRTWRTRWRRSERWLQQLIWSFLGYKWSSLTTASPSRDHNTSTGAHLRIGLSVKDKKNIVKPPGKKRTIKIRQLLKFHDKESVINLNKQFINIFIWKNRLLWNISLRLFQNTRPQRFWN